MKPVKVAWIIYLIVLICIYFIGYGIAHADTLEPAKIADCTYVPKPSDEVYYTCSEQAIGTVEVKLWICGQPYTIDVKCPK